MRNMLHIHTEKRKHNINLSQQASTALDAIRFFSAQMVLVGHGVSLCGITFLRNQTYFPYIQNIGVVFLLLISGYLMGYKIRGIYSDGRLNAEKCGEIYKKFILNKAGRIYAGLFPAVVFVWLIDSIAIIQAPDSYSFYSNFTFRNFLASLTMIQKIPAFGSILYFGSAPQIWTLSIEWWIFMLCGYIAFYVNPLWNTGCLRMKHLLVLLLLSYPVIHYIYSGEVPVLPIIWLLGMFVYFLQEKLTWRIDRISQLLFVLLSTIILIQIGAWKRDAYSVEFVLFSAVLLLIITAESENAEKMPRISNWFRLAASTTYSLYLVHYSIMEYFMSVYPQMEPVKKFGLMIVFSEIAAILFSSLFENKGKLLSEQLISVMSSKKRTIGAGLLVGVLFLSGILANSPKGTGCGFSGLGTKDSPYVIGNVEEFIKFRDLVNAGESFPSIYFYQSEDLDLAGTGNWEPIGLCGSGKYFAGYYDGGGHVIHNLNCVAEDESVGLFGMLIGQVRNLGIESGVIKGGCVGSIASHGGKTAAIINCYNKAEVYGTIRAGGIADNFAGEILFCINLGDVVCNNPDNAAGLVSYDCAALVYSYSIKAPIIASEFSGNLIKSDTVSLDELNEKFLEERYHLIRNWRDNFAEAESMAQMILHKGSICMYPKRFGTAAHMIWALTPISCSWLVLILILYRFHLSKCKN